MEKIRVFRTLPSYHKNTLRTSEADQVSAHDKRKDFMATNEMEAAPGAVSTARKHTDYNTKRGNSATPKRVHGVPLHPPLLAGLDDLWWELFDRKDSDPTAAATLRVLDGFIDTRYLIKDLNTFAKEARPLLDHLGPIRGDEAVSIDQSVFTVEGSIFGRHLILICTTGQERGWQITGYTVPLVQGNEDEIEDWTRPFGPIPLNLGRGQNTAPHPRGVLEWACPKLVRDVVRLHNRGLLQLEPIEYGSGLEVGATYNVTVAPS